MYHDLNISLATLLSVIFFIMYGLAVNQYVFLWLQTGCQAATETVSRERMSKLGAGAPRNPDPAESAAL